MVKLPGAGRVAPDELIDVCAFGVDNNIAAYHVVAALVPHVEPRRDGADADVVLNQAEKPFAQLEAHTQAEVIVEMVVGRAVVEVDAPGVAAPVGEAVVADDGGLEVIELADTACQVAA
ncbi:hypothetical protein ES703_99311 [subsurface metagenome]